MNPVETYLSQIQSIRSSGAGVDETSYYPALSGLLNEVGKSLKPKVQCVLQLKNLGAGNPDGGLFTADQLKSKGREEAERLGQIPGRGAIEVKPPSEDAVVIAGSQQVRKYLARYRQVLVTTLREFVLLGQDGEGKPVVLEKFRLTESEAAFWAAAQHPRKTAATHGALLVEFLKRVMLYPVRLAAPEDVAFFLASFAREALTRIEGQELDALQTVRKALEEALGLKFEGTKGEHFFRSSLVQTLFYGIFSAWVIWAKQRPPGSRERFEWATTSRLLRVPVLRKLFHLMADPGQLEALSLNETLDRTAGVLNRVDRPEFFARFRESHAVQYFYEPFLAAFDPELRKQLGIWFTPQEIVQYMVARVDTALREELGLADGLADKQVYVLDPCCGTGSYLVEVLRRIQQTLQGRDGDALLSSDLKEAARDRIFGFEILPAPFVVAHLQLGLLLQSLGAPLADKADERVGVYLTNALTGWEPPKGPKTKLLFPELEEERHQAEKVKRKSPILVVLGNPPYNAFAGVSPAEEHGLVGPYKEGLVKKWGIKKFNLDDLYVRFFRLAQRRIVEMTGRGVVCYISNFSYLGDPSFVVMRQGFLQEFDKMWFDCMNGDSRETGKLTPDGKPDPSVFSTEYNREGIRVGTAVGLLVRTGKSRAKSSVGFRHFWGVTKRADLLESLKAKNFNSAYQVVRPAESNRYSFRAQQVEDHYLDWPALTDLAESRPTLGILENRQDSLISIDRTPLEERMQLYFDQKVGWDELKNKVKGITQDFARFDAKKTRDKVLAKETFSPESVRPLMVRPMDNRWCYHSLTRPLWNEPRPEFFSQLWEGNSFLVSRRRGVASPEGVPFCFIRTLGFQHALHTDAYYIPLRLRDTRREDKAAKQSSIPVSSPTRANLSGPARAYLSSLGLQDADSSPDTCGLVWMHALAIGYATAYLSENADGIRQDWPRIPLPASRERLEASGELGRQVSALLDTQLPVEGVSPGRLRPEMKVLGVFTRVDNQPLKEEDLLALTTGWGHTGKGGVVMPGKGKIIEREYTPAEREAITEGARALGLSPKDAFARLGEKTFDIYLNEHAYWSNVAEKVWDYFIGGYQVIKKWLSYREQKLLGRPLTKDEARYVQEMVRRLAALRLLEPALDENYQAVKQRAYSWSSVR